jgi:hypothetical protein
VASIEMRNDYERSTQPRGQRFQQLAQRL